MCVCVSKLDRKGGYSTDSLFHPACTRIPTFYLIDDNKQRTPYTNMIFFIYRLVMTLKSNLSEILVLVFFVPSKFVVR